LNSAKTLVATLDTDTNFRRPRPSAHESERRSNPFIAGAPTAARRPDPTAHQVSKMDHQRIADEHHALQFSCRPQKPPERPT
jgi:hypothetical protein